MKKQITIQLELPLEHIYQMTLLTVRKIKAAKKVIPNIPAMFQLPIELNQKTKKRSINLAMIGGIIAGVTAGICLAKYLF